MKITAEEFFLKKLAKYYECELKVFDLNKLNSYIHYLHPSKVAKYANGNYGDKAFNFIVALVKNDYIILDSGHCSSKQNAFFNLKRIYCKELVLPADLYHLDFKFSRKNVKRMMNEEWLNASSAEEVELFQAIRKG